MTLTTPSPNRTRDPEPLAITNIQWRDQPALAVQDLAILALVESPGDVSSRRERGRWCGVFTLVYHYSGDDGEAALMLGASKLRRSVLISNISTIRSV
jgi:hypothetical protein